jgi:hypothetical protein
MEHMVVRSEDGRILTTDNSTGRSRPLLFNKEYISSYMYQINKNKTSFYLYNYFEAICFQCEFFKWDEIRKFVNQFIHVSIKLTLI